MSFLTYGPLKISVLVAPEEITYEQIVDHVAADHYGRGDVPRTGWVRIDVEQEDKADGRPGIPTGVSIAPRTTAVGIDGLGDFYILPCRLVEDVENRRLLDVVGDEIFATLTDEQRYVQRMIDLVVVKPQSADSKPLLVAATHDDEDIALLVHHLPHVEVDDPDGPPPPGYQRVGRPPSDFFLWLVWRWIMQQHDLGSGMVLRDMRELRAVSQNGPETVARRGIDAERVDVLAAVALRHDLGPVKITLDDDQLGVTCDLNVLLDGALDIHRGMSRFKGNSYAPAVFGLRAAIAVALRIAPTLMACCRGDESWHGPARTAFEQHAAHEIRRLIPEPE